MGITVELPEIGLFTHGGLLVQLPQLHSVTPGCLSDVCWATSGQACV
jgi:hypothetical protein